MGMGTGKESIGSVAPEASSTCNMNASIDVVPSRYLWRVGTVDKMEVSIPLALWSWHQHACESGIGSDNHLCAKTSTEARLLL